MRWSHPRCLLKVEPRSQQNGGANNCVMHVSMTISIILSINDVCRHLSDDYLYHSFQDNSYYIENGGHFF